MRLEVLNTILPPSAAECDDSSLVHPFQTPALSRAGLSVVSNENAGISGMPCAIVCAGNVS